MSCNIFDSPSVGSIERPYLEVYLRDEPLIDIGPDQSYRQIFVDEAKNSEGRQFRIFPDQLSGTASVTKSLTNFLGDATTGLNYIVFVAVGDKIELDAIILMNTGGAQIANLANFANIDSSTPFSNGFDNRGRLGAIDDSFGSLGNNDDGFKSFDFETTKVATVAQITNIQFVIKGTK